MKKLVQALAVITLTTNAVVTTSAFANQKQKQNSQIVESKQNSLGAKINTFIPDWISNINALGNNGFNWHWKKTRNHFINIAIKLAPEAVRYFYPAIADSYHNFLDILLKGITHLYQGWIWDDKSPSPWDSSYVYKWFPFENIKNLFADKAKEENFLKTLQDELLMDQDNMKTVLLNAQDLNWGIVENLEVDTETGKIDTKNSKMTYEVVNRSSLEQDGINDVRGDNEFVGNELKIFFNAQYTQLIHDFLKTKDQFWTWLIGSKTAPFSFPKGSEIEGLTKSGAYLKNGVEAPLWETSSLHLIKQEIFKEGIFQEIQKTAEENQFKDGMMLKFVRTEENQLFTTVEPQGHPRALTEVSEYNKIGSNPLFDRWYNSYFDPEDLLEIYNIDTSNHFYNWLTYYGGSGWKHGQEFRNSETVSDLDDIQEIINGKINIYIDSEQIFNWDIFKSWVQFAIQNKKMISLKFHVIYKGLYYHNHYGIYINSYYNYK